MQDNVLTSFSAPGMAAVAVIPTVATLTEVAMVVVVTEAAVVATAVVVTAAAAAMAAATVAAVVVLPAETACRTSVPA